MLAKVIITDIEIRGSGEPPSPIRRVVQVWTLDGRLIAEMDPCLAKITEGEWEEKVKEHTSALAHLSEAYRLLHVVFDIEKKNLKIREALHAENQAGWRAEVAMLLRIKESEE